MVILNKQSSFKAMNTRISRRRFVQASAAAAFSAASWSRVQGANNRIGVGCIGVGLIGRIHLRNFHALPGAQVVAVSEVYQPRMEAAAALAPGCARHADFRKLLEDKSVDVVVVNTPDHWHALMTMMSCAAGKDVYVEKPLTLFVKEGLWMNQVAQRFKRVVQVGTQQRSGPHYQKARDLIRSGHIGKLVSVQIHYFRNVSPGFGRPADSAPPSGLNWDLFLGPAPMRAYNPNRGLYHFRWFWDTSGGQMTNLGQHSLDVVHWITGVNGARAVTSSGGRNFLEDNCEVPDTQDALIEYPGFRCMVQFRECAAGLNTTGMGGVEFHGTRGTMVLGRDGFEVIGDKRENPTNILARIVGGHPVGGPQPVPEPAGAPARWTEPAKDQTGDWKNQYVLHAQNFLDCVRSRSAPISDLQSGHEIATVCHLANISLRTGRKLRWNLEKQEIADDREAGRMLSRPYRAPWDRELRSLGIRT